MPSAAIFDCEGARLSAEERAFFKDVDPWGFIVFARHCSAADQLRAHCDELRECVGRADAPILIDQEGGRVARMRPPDFPRHEPPARLGELWRLDPQKAKAAARLNAELIARMVAACGVTVNCSPMLDVPQPDADPTVIGDRALAAHVEIIAALGAEVAAGTRAGGALPVIKHLPGHGRALCDSHHELPTVGASLDDLRAVDFAPFIALQDEKMGMTAHVVYEAIDPERPATLSPIVVNDIIRGEIGFDGLLFTDDLRMNALSGEPASRIADSYEAGCDIALCCNFTLAEKQASALALRPLDGKSLMRATSAMAEIGVPDALDLHAAYERLHAYLRPVLA